MDLLVFVLFCVGVLLGVSLVLASLSKPGENFLIRFVERIGKKLFPAVIVFLLLALPAGARAGGSNVFSSFQEHRIVEAVLAGFDNNIFLIEMNHFPDCSEVACQLVRPSVKVIFSIHSTGGIDITGVGDERYRSAILKKSVAVKKRIEAILNQPASVELGRNLIK